MDEIIPDANVLQKNASQKRQLQEFVIEILKRLRDELRVARQMGGFELSTTLPIQFEVPNIKNRDCQRIVWASIIKILKSKGYRVKIHPQEKKCALQVKWLSREDEQEVAEQMSMLAEHMDKTL